jgi:hypothetical protein
MYPSDASRRENAEARLDLAAVIARSESDEAIQLSLRGKMDCFVALAMTEVELRACNTLSRRHPRKPVIQYSRGGCHRTGKPRRTEVGEPGLA